MAMSDKEFAQLSLRLAESTIDAATAAGVYCIVLTINPENGRPFTATTLDEDAVMKIFKSMAENTVHSVVTKERDQ